MLLSKFAVHHVQYLSRETAQCHTVYVLCTDALYTVNREVTKKKLGQSFSTETGPLQ